MAMEYVVKNQDFSEFDGNKKLTLERIDKNGTHYYINHTCPKCGGTGNLPYYDYIEGGICFLCNGSGYRDTKVIVRTYEYSEKLRLRRLAKMRAGATEANRKWCRDNGLAEDCTTYVVLGDTYKIKEQLKAAGAKYDRVLGWHFDREQDTYPVLKITKDQKLEEGYYFINELCNGRYEFGAPGPIERFIKKANNEYLASIRPASEYIGEVGSKFEGVLTYKKTAEFETHYTYYGGISYIHTFMDNNGNVVIWKTTNGLGEWDKDGKYKGVNPEDQLKIKGTIKEHTEYKGLKQTVLTRCKIIR